MKVLVISAYPTGGTYSHKLTGAAGYTKNILTSVKKANPNIDFEVLAEIENGRQRYAQAGIQINRVWKYGSWMTFALLVWLVVTKYASYKKILFAFEWTMFSKSKLSMTLIPLLILIFRLFGKKVYFISHAVLLDAKLIAGQLDIKESSLKSMVATAFMRIFYFSIVMISHKVIVFEEGLKCKLIKLFSKSKKIVTIPHGVSFIPTRVTKSDARKRLNIKKSEFVILNFGFLSWYKGSDRMVKWIEKYNSLHKNKVKLIIAGGANMRNMSDLVYAKYISDVQEMIKKQNGDVQMTGFIPEHKIAEYFLASDLVVLPHRVFLSSSGPLSFTFGYKKPVLFSNALSEYFRTQDMNNTKEVIGLRDRDLVFKSYEQLEELIERFQDDRNFKNKLTKFSSLMNDRRSWIKIGEQYERLFI